MADLEFIVTNGTYESALSEPATYIDGSKRETSVKVVPNQDPGLLVETAEPGVRGVGIVVRVRVSDVAQPCKGDRIIYHDREHCVDEYDRLNIAEWILYAVA